MGSKSSFSVLSNLHTLSGVCTLSSMVAGWLKSMTNPPDIHTGRLFLSAFCTSDANDMFEYNSNPNVARYTSWVAHKSIEETRGFIRWVLEVQCLTEGQLRCNWAIRLRENPKVIGSIALAQTDEHGARVDYVLSEDFWNQGIMTEATKAVVGWTFRTYSSLATVESGGLTENHGSMRVLKKCGMRLKRRSMKRFVKFGDKEKEVSEYWITRSGWYAES